jgi:multidrug efflux pump subunit AcrA (membrane-fusion protein)
MLMKKLFSTLFLALMINLSACASLPSSTPPVQTKAPPPPQTNFLPSGGVVASAKVVPLHESRMSFPISAPVKDVLVKEGDLVKAGQHLMTLYEPDLELSVTSAELELKAAELDLVYWINRFDRPPERRQQARAETEQARTKLKSAQASFAQTSLVAPFDATVVDINIQAGEFAQTGQVVIILGDLANMQVETTDLSERDVPAVQIGQAVNVYIQALNTNVTGKVIRISPISKVVGGDVVYPVTVKLDEQPDGLLWGMTAEVKIQAAQ